MTSRQTFSLRLCRATIVARRTLFPAAALVCVLAAPARAQQTMVLPEKAPIQQPQMLDLNLMQALLTIGHADLAGIFGFVPPESAPVALADYLLHDRKALKKLIKKEQKDIKDVGGVSAWDKAVFVQLLQLHNGGMIPPGVEGLSKKEELEVSEIVLARGMTLQDMAIARGAKQQ